MATLFKITLQLFSLFPLFFLCSTCHDLTCYMFYFVVFPQTKMKAS